MAGKFRRNTRQREAWRPDLEAAPELKNIGSVFSDSLLQDQRQDSEYLLRKLLVYEKKDSPQK